MTPVAEPSLLDVHHADGLGNRGDDLTIGGVSVRSLADAYGTPLYVYSGDAMRKAYRRLQDALAGFAEVYYSIKANPNPSVAGLFVEEGAGLEVASGGEFILAQAAGCHPERMLFAGPGKAVSELELALGAGLGEVHIESFEEIARVAKIGQRFGRRIAVAIRVNPVATAQGGAMRMGGRPAAFGFDEELLEDVIEAVKQRPALDLVGIHLFAGTQILDADVLLAQWRHALALGGRIAQRQGRPIGTIDLGGGLGVPYHKGDRALDLSRVACGVPALREQVRADPLLREARIIVEPGRYLTASAGVYLTRINCVKLSRGTRFIVTDGGMHHHLAASGNLGQVVKRDYPIVPATRLGDRERTATQIVGPLCTPLDTFGRQTSMPRMQEGDLIAVLQSGAYGLSASPFGFLSHPTPAEVLIENGEHRIIRPRGSFCAPVQPYPLPPAFNL